MVAVMDFRKVLEYGDPIVLLPPGRVSLTPGPTVDALKQTLKDFTDEDYIVSVGDPSAMFIAAMVIGQINRNRCQLLKWDKDSKRYIKVAVDLNYRINQAKDIL
jgi:hypothetical protein